MGARLLKCNKCGNTYSIENMSEKDGHQCICGEMLCKFKNYIGYSENANMPNKPLGVWKRTDSEKPSFPAHNVSIPFHHGDDGIEVVKPLHKKIAIDIECGMGLDELIEKVKGLRECFKDIPGHIVIDNDGKVGAIPVISVDSKLLVFRSIAPLHKEDRKTLAKEYTDKLGIKCEVIDYKTELVAVIDG